jgi:dUTP pyrophosphatase
MEFERVHAEAILPSRSSEMSAGYDLYTPTNGTIPSRGRMLIPIGWKIRIPGARNDPNRTLYGRIAPRSGLALRNGLDVGAGVIDADYSQEIGVIIFNHSDYDFVYKKGDRIAQLIIETCHTEWTCAEVDKLSVVESGREGGFGSTGR